MLAFLTNLGLPELIVILVIAVLVFGKDLPQAASKAYLQVRKLRNAVDDLRRDSGIERELRDIERTVREAEWEARREPPPERTVARASLPMAPVPPVVAPPVVAPSASSETPAPAPPPSDEPDPKPTAEAS